MNNHEIRAVIWDIGGVLVRTADREPRTRLAQRFGMTREELVYLVFDSKVGRQAQAGSIRAADLWAYVCTVLHVSPGEIPALEREFFGGDFVDMELVDYIRRLRSRYLTGIISNAWDDVRQTMTNRWKIADAFDYIVISGEIKLVKPDPRIYQAALQGLGVRADQAIFVDDALDNVDGAQSVGMHAIQFRNLEQISTDLNQLLDVKMILRGGLRAK